MRRSTPGRRFRFLSVFLALSFLMTACGGGGGGGDSKGLTKIRFLLDYAIGGEHSPYAVAVDRGFFKEEGLDVELFEGTGSADTMQLVANGAADFGNAQASALVFGVVKGFPVKAVANFNPTSGFILDWIRGRTPDLESPKDLEGKTLGLELGDPDAGILPVLLKINDVDRSKINIVNANDTRVALLRGKIDVRIGQLESLPEVEALDPSLDHGVLLFSDYGLDLLAHSIITSESFFEDNKDVVQAFVRAVQRAWKYTVENPDAALDTTMKLFPAADREALALALKLTLDNLKREAPEGKPLGYVSPERWEQSVEVLKNIDPEEGEEPQTIDVPATTFYTNEFISEDF